MGRRRWPAQRRTFGVDAFSPRTLRWVLAGLATAVAVLLFLGQGTVRIVEAHVAVALLAIAQVAGTQAFGTDVLFRMHGAFVGVNITTSCSAALLLSPFFLLAGGLFVSRRTSVGSGLRTLGMVALWLFAMNQARILLIVLSMRAWGFERGYELSHIAFGSVISTLGVLGGVALFVRSVSRAPTPVDVRS